MTVVDLLRWLEFNLGGKGGPLFKPVIEQRDQLLVPVIALYEVHKVLSPQMPSSVVEKFLKVMRMGRVIDLTDQRAIAAAVAASQHNLAMADAAMYSIALEFKATFWTQDADYEGLVGVQYFAKA